jgi:hypothetical protein
MKIIKYLAWAWVIIIGGLMITPGGVLCISNSHFENKRR